MAGFVRLRLKIRQRGATFLSHAVSSSSPPGFAYGIAAGPPTACAPIGSSEGQRYLGAMRCAINYAFANRQVIAPNTRAAFAHALRMRVDEIGLRLKQLEHLREDVVWLIYEVTRPAVESHSWPSSAA